VIRELQSFGADVDVYDPHASSDEVEHEYGIRLIDRLDKKYSAIVLAVSHQEFKKLDWTIIRNDQTIVYDVKGFLERSQISARL
jgi:UDP-N-acetyl-D-galactosamine dehydrogenase